VDVIQYSETLKTDMLKEYPNHMHTETEVMPTKQLNSPKRDFKKKAPQEVFECPWDVSLLKEDLKSFGFHTVDASEILPSVCTLFIPPCTSGFYTSAVVQKLFSSNSNVT